MKIRNIIVAVLLLAFAALSCQKHEILYYIDHEGTDDVAMFQLIYVPPIASNQANGIDSIYVNGKLVSNLVRGRLIPKGVAPYGNTYYTAPAGNVHIQFMKDEKYVYDRSVSLDAGKIVELYVYDLQSDPKILDHDYDNITTHSPAGSASTYQMDSVASYRFANFLFQSDGTTPYGKLQYQYSNNTSNYTSGDWHNLGEPVGFGEITTRNLAIVHKTIDNSSGYQTLRFRCVDPVTGEMVAGTGDYWTSYLGRAYTHVINGRFGGSPAPNYMQIGNSI